MIGQTISTYKVVEKLSEGGMGAVYKAVDTQLQREVAIKVLKPELASQTAIVERFRMEAMTLARLNHPNIATLHSFFDQDNELFMILEYVSGETLDRVLQRLGPIPWGAAIPIFAELLDCVSHAHEFGVIHRDIKPANLMLTEKGTLKVLDFGIARLRGSARITRTGNIIGTLEYMSPEQTKGQETDARSDIYSLGMTLYEILTGVTPFNTDNEFDLIQKQVSEMPPSPRSINPAIPEEIEAAIIKSYAKNPDERFQTAEEFRRVLLKAISSKPESVKTAASTIKQPSTQPLQFGLAAPLVSENTSRGMAVDSPETPTVEIDTESLFATNNADSAEIIDAVFFSKEETEKKVSNDFSEATKSVQNQPSFLSQLKAVHFIAAGTGISALIALLLSLPLIISKSETVAPKVETVEIKEEIQPTAIQSIDEAIAQKQPEPTAIQGKPAKKENTPKTIPIKLIQRTTAVRFNPPSTSAPKPIKKQAASLRETEAQRLRRAERLLTGN